MDGCTNAILAICITPGKASVFPCFRALVFVVRISNGARERAECSEVCRVLGRVLSEGPPGGPVSLLSGGTRALAAGVRRLGAREGGRQTPVLGDSRCRPARFPNNLSD